jgi:hypothetical protein
VCSNYDGQFVAPPNTLKMILSGTCSVELIAGMKSFSLAIRTLLSYSELLCCFAATYQCTIG